MRQHLFRRIFILYAVAVVVAGLVAEVFVASEVRKNHIAEIRRSLHMQIGLVAEDLSMQPASGNALCMRIKAATGARATLVASDGSVVADSDADYRAMENHAGRTEVAQAALFGEGMAIRKSGTLDHDFLYVARKVSGKDGKGGFLRLAVPLRELDDAVAALRLRFLVIVAVAMLIAGGAALIQMEWLRRLLSQITDFSRSLAKGEIRRRLFLENAGEFNEIADNLTRMSEKLQETLGFNEEERRRLSVILRSMPDVLLIVDARGSIELASESAKGFFETADLQGRLLIDIIRNDDFVALVDAAGKERTAKTGELRLDLSRERILSVRVSPLSYHEGELSGLVVVMHDITEMKLLEQVRKDFVANVSHELKTPITAIRGFADTLIEGAIDDRENALKFLQTIRANSERIDSLVDDLMTISKIELGVIRVRKTDVDPRVVFESVLSVLRDKAAAKGLEMSVVCPVDVQAITADRDRVIQIMTNLVDNAVKFTETGRILFGLERCEGQPCLFVEDTGVGVAAQHIPRLGERFYRVDPARSRTMGGTGLGLAIVKHLVKAHGWTFKVESTPGRGTKVRIILEGDKM